MSAIIDGSNASSLPADSTINGVTVGKGGGNVSTNTAVGVSALTSNTSAVQSTANGYQTGYLQTTGSFNSYFGYQSGYSNTTGTSNNGVGYKTLYANTGSANNAFGESTLSLNTTGSYNSAFGHSALLNNTTGGSNTSFGTQALQANTTASNNTAVGYQAGYSSTGEGNTYLGWQAGYATTGIGNVLLGRGTSTASAGDNYEIVIGYATGGKGSSTAFIQCNGGGSYQSNNSTLWSVTSDQRLKKNIVDNTDGLNKITAIQVRNFEYRTADEVTELEPQNAINIKGVQLGAIAQELQAILPECVKTESTGVMSVDSSNLTWYLINAVKELKAEVDALKAAK